MNLPILMEVKIEVLKAYLKTSEKYVGWSN